MTPRQVSFGDGMPVNQDVSPTNITPDKASIIALSKMFPRQSPVKVDKRIKYLSWLLTFYQNKVDDESTPIKLRDLFQNYVVTLPQAIQTLRNYSKLTAKLAELADEPKPDIKLADKISRGA